MSGGFFRGTSADQDTRFSNKQAKLLKSQKFAAELDHLVDMTKVKMDVIRPWIATRATELLGFEDEVLINFVYGLLDAKEVDGKQIQIQLTGFMEKNTGKFMKELWSLLLSAQNNVSGVPQQFLDAKEEETRKKKAETDRIAHEIQKRRDRDGREPQRERKSRFDGEVDGSKFTKVDSDSKFSKPKASRVPPEEAREVEAMHGSRLNDGPSRSPPPNNHSRHSRSPPSNNHSLSPRIIPSPTRSNDKSISRSRSHSQERHKSRSLSASSRSPEHSISPRRNYQSPERRSFSPKRRYRSPPRGFISPHRGYSRRDSRSPLRQRSPPRRRRSRSRHRSPSPFRYRSPLARRRSPLRRRSPSPVRRRSPSPVRRRSPLRRRSPSPLQRRSPSPVRRRSPLRRRTPSPLQRRSSPSRGRSPIKDRRRSPSPLRRRSPIWRRSPAKHRSRSPLRRRSPLSKSPNHRRRTPLHSPRSRPADSPPQRKRSRSPYGSRSLSPQTCRSLSRERDGRVNGNESRRYRDEKISGRDDAKQSLTNHALEREFGQRISSKRKVPISESHNLPVSLRSPQRDARNQGGDRKKILAVSPENSPSHSESPSDMQKVNSRSSRRSRSRSKSPIRMKNIQSSRHDSQGTSEEEERMPRAREVSHHRTDPSRRRSKDSPRDVKPDRREFSQSPAPSVHQLPSELKKKDSKQGSDMGPREEPVQRPPISSKGEHVSGRVQDESGPGDHIHDRRQSAKPLKRDVSFDRREHIEQAVNDGRKHRKGGDEYSEVMNNKSKEKMDEMDIRSRLNTKNSDPEETDLYRNDKMEKRRYKKSDKRKRDYDETSESDSQIDDKKEAKKRRKDEKRLRKEERRRRREERHRRKLERRTGKLKLKSIDTVSPPSDFDKVHSDADESNDGTRRRKNSYTCDVDESESEQKRLEIELREKALESLRAKKAISH